MSDSIHQLVRDQRGATYVEYLVLTGLVALTVAASAGELGQSLPDAFIRLCLRMLGVQ